MEISGMLNFVNPIDELQISIDKVIEQPFVTKPGSSGNTFCCYKSERSEESVSWCRKETDSLFLVMTA